MKKGIQLVLLLVLAHHSNSQSNKEFTMENFEREVLSYEATQNDISDKDFNFGKMILSEVKKDVNNNPENFNCADYYNVFASLISLKESDKNIRVAFDKLTSSEGSCEYFLSKKMFDSEKYDRIRTSINLQISSCTTVEIPEPGPDESVEDETLDTELVRLIRTIGERDEKYRHDEEIDWDKQHALDAKNQVQIDSLYAIYGEYLGTSIVGEKHNYIMWSVIQHSNLEMMEKYLPIVHQAFIDGQLGVTPLKLLIDRYYGLKHGYQIFGSQSGFGFELADEETRTKIKTKYQID